MDKPKCKQHGCNNDAACKIYWPGQDVLLSCGECASKALGLASSMGFLLVVEKLGDSDG